MFSVPKKHRLLALTAVSALVFVFAAALGGHLFNEPSYGKTPAVIPALAVPAVSDPAASRIPASGTFAPVVKEAAPAVVSITVSKTERAPAVMRGFPFPFGPEGFGPAPDQGGEYRSQGAGSGVIVNQEGYIVTNHHVIDGAEEIEVHLSDKRDFKAELVGTDAKTDIAVLKVDATNLPVLPFGNSDDVQIGDIVLAIGNPFGIGQTVTMGIVGATGRGNLGIEDYEDFIQTDAAINPGNSGGALINVHGELVGINTAILARGGGGNQGVGFAVPVNLAHHVMTQLTERGRVVRGYLGVNIQNLDAKMAEAFNVRDARGAVVGGVQPDGPAAKAGLKQGDLIVGMDGKSFQDARELRLSVANEPPGSTVNLAVIRDGDEKTIPVKLGEFPDENPGMKRSSTQSSSSMGLSVDDLTPAVARQLDLPAGVEGVVVVNVKPGSPAAETGLKRGDVIREVARQPVTSAADFGEAIRNAGDSVLLLIQRGENTFFVVVEAN